MGHFNFSMKTLTLLTLLIVFSALCDAKKFKKKSNLLKALKKPFSLLPVPIPIFNNEEEEEEEESTEEEEVHVKCDVIWEEKVTPLCKTKHNKVCEPVWNEVCHKVWEDECWDEPVEKCHQVKQCHTETQNVCKTEYTVECEDAHHHKHHGYDHHDHHKREAEVEASVESGEDLNAELEALSRRRRGAKLIAKPLKKLAFAVGLGSQTTSSPDNEDDEEAHVETLCHHHPHTKCWDEPVEKCHNVPECHTEQVQRCKKVPREVCEKVESQKCWDEPEEHCEYMRVKVAKKYCRKPKQW